MIRRTSGRGSFLISTEFGLLAYYVGPRELLKETGKASETIPVENERKRRAGDALPVACLRTVVSLEASNRGDNRRGLNG